MRRYNKNVNVLNKAIMKALDACGFCKILFD